MIDIPEPPNPVWELTTKDIEPYFPSFKEGNAMKKGINITGKWAKEIGDEIQNPTEIPDYDEELNQLPPEERKEIVAIIQNVYDKGGDAGVESLVLAIKTIKELEEEGNIVGSELSGKKLLEEARRLQNYFL